MVIGVLITNSPWLFLEFSADLPVIYLSSTPMPDIASAFRACRTAKDQEADEAQLANARSAVEREAALVAIADA